MSGEVRDAKKGKMKGERKEGRSAFQGDVSGRVKKRGKRAVI